MQQCVRPRLGVSAPPACLGRAAARAACLAALLAVAAPASAQSFTGLGYLPGGSDSNIWISADGSAAAGYCGTPSGHRAVRWTPGGGMVSLSTLLGDTYSFGYGASGDGSVIVGYSGAIGGSDSAFRWTEAGGLEDLGVLPGAMHSYAQAVSRDGLTVVGDSRDFFSGIAAAFRWTSTTGMIELPTLASGFSAAYGVSADGSVTVGYSPSNLGDQACRWVNGVPQGLGMLAGDAYSYAYGVSADGSVVVGFSGVDFTDDRAFRWTAAGGMVSLGTLPGRAHAAAYAVSDDGSIVVGSAYGDVAGTERALLWSEATGLVDLNLYLPTLGIDLTGWTLVSSAAITADGRTISGIGRHNGASEAWIAHLGGGSEPCPGDVDDDGDVDLSDLAVLLSNFGRTDASRAEGDFDGDADVDLSDLAILLGSFGAACP